MTKKSKKIRKFLSQVGICWRNVYLVTGNDNSYLQSFFHNIETGKDFVRFTNEIKEAMSFDSFEKAYWWTFLISSCTDPKDSFVRKAKMKGKNNNAKILLSKERYYA